MSSTFELFVDPGIRQVLTENYNIIDCLEFKQFDLDFDWLAKWLHANQRDSFDVNDRFVIVHFDSDFYWKKNGINLNNFFEMWKYYDLPLYTIILYTNHIGIRQEVNSICKRYHSSDQPTVIETVVNAIGYQPDRYADISINANAIDMHAVCLMGGTPRSHRWATFNHLRDLSPDCIAMTLTGTEK
jgi:hypothetical protein